ncbi:1,2-phenylacetyl-CoA epoxidase subunit PaaC [Bacillus sp. 1P06AnD]|uniref:1,2-phenylacetyl-CoA epoxidase subunit PaaC n=1 Tax=Bacillus sp. 1P06AnD TaxID=3132208 RepID=UPI0039A25934
MNERMNKDEKEALVDLLFQLADDDFLYAFRGSEWLGLVPHIEEDVASASITQDSMGHANMFFAILQDLNIGSCDKLAHARKPAERRNCILVERVNGPGDYSENPRFDWAYAVCRNFLYSVAKKVKMQSLKSSSYGPLSHIATRVLMELYYHELHWRTWFIQLVNAEGEGRNRMVAALQQVMADCHDLFHLGSYAGQIVDSGLIDEEITLYKGWKEELALIMERASLSLPEHGIQQGHNNGRLGDHTEDLQQALLILSEVYATDEKAIW